MAGSLIPTNSPEIPGTSSAKFPGAPAKTPSRGNFSRAPGGDRVRDLKGQFAGGYAINWNGLQVIQADLIEYEATGVPLDAQMELLANDIQKYAWDNAPWQDQTGEARDGLTAEVQRRPNGEVAVVLFHTKDYGVYLENANGGAFAIIIPTMEHFAAQLGTRIFGPGANR